MDDEREQQQSALRELGLPGLVPGADLLAVVRLVAAALGVGKAVINIIDGDQQCQLAPVGFAGAVSSRSDSMCAVHLAERRVVWTADARTDPSFRTNPWVTGELGAVRFYASAPLVTGDGAVLGTLCVFDDGILQPTPQQLAVLEDAATVVVALFERARDARILHAARAQLEQRNEELARRADYDVLTDLPNRALLQVHLAEVLARAQRDGGVVGLLFIDLDAFKALNDTHGHAAGDLALKEVARRLRACLRAGDLVGRLGGDEFVMVCATRGRKALASIAARVDRVLSEPFHLDTRPLPLTATVGVAACEAGTLGADQLLAAADAAMYEAKRARPQAR
ncbi:diguanylate cyclase with GAF sensor [Motilibacter rhizosphaerae]|uniref:Diguanylate cyclase with GAF sensor n=1 Tax=Motilibacter rhizosphaerae TaxID=598652 RepID=A0A4Q7NVK9_9ACTN|nr:sensor domain-containing diguanylate cyclase [Motilibacter rhizosphaerae]RZS91174.1 diguanylate cyclase with GAF sensor [Motilibacter rhizosphaerae]